MVSTDIDMLRNTFVIAVMNAFGRFAVDADNRFRTACVRHAVLPSVHEALAARVITAFRMLSAYHNVALAAASVLIVRASFRSTL